jgi:hypothetical protein
MLPCRCIAARFSPATPQFYKLAPNSGCAFLLVLFDPAK